MQTRDYGAVYFTPRLLQIGIIASAEYQPYNVVDQVCSISPHLFVVQPAHLSCKVVFSPHVIKSNNVVNCLLSSDQSKCRKHPYLEPLNQEGRFFSIDLQYSDYCCAVLCSHIHRCC
jgi:hypothetical protein